MAKSDTIFGLEPGGSRRLMKGSVAYELEGAARLDFTPQDLLCEIDFPSPKAQG